MHLAQEVENAMQVSLVFECIARVGAYGGGGMEEKVQACASPPCLTGGDISSWDHKGRHGKTLQFPDNLPRP